jgi:hypothetical protein
LVLAGSFRILQTVVNGYRIQQLLTDMHQTAQFAIGQVTERLAEAGSGLSSRDTALSVAGPSTFSVLVNPRGSMHVFTAADTARPAVSVGRGRDFWQADSVRWTPADTALPTVVVRIDPVDIGAFRRGVDTLGDSVRLLGYPHNFRPGDALAPYRSEKYYLSVGNLCLNTDDNVLAENVDSFTVQFFDDDSTQTDSWKQMSWARCRLTVRSNRPDPSYRGTDDGYRRVSLGLDFRLRNRF